VSKKPIPVIDLFAGPGGLNEGFSRLGEDSGSPQFETVGSFEMESSAINTLRLRGLYRHLLRNSKVPDSYYEFIRGERSWESFLAEPGIADAFEASSAHVHQVELGSDDDDSDALIEAALHSAEVTAESPWVLIGGPPCQAYSLAGRSRRANDETFATDKKHFLYREYLRIITTFSPPVFVMENVKGLLSSSTDEHGGMFAKIKSDLENRDGKHRYTIHSVVSDKEPDQLSPRDFVIRAECYGVPQKRHRVILVGIRKDYFDPTVKLRMLETSERVTVGQALAGMPRLRSGISPGRDDKVENWLAIRDSVSSQYGQSTSGSRSLTRGEVATPFGVAPESSFGDWVRDPALTEPVQHESRSHMIEDLKRYWYAANHAKSGSSPKLSNFPSELQPLHKNAGAANRPFEDRFRVQVADQPSTTVVSHISKDGHYYIHPDPMQMRSLTVREAARLQSFPDNYFFSGNRTQQYHQVGNAVPPLLATQIAAVIAALFVDQC
jgi:DNA (cytosine-5)-methyltransferase 1